MKRITLMIAAVLVGMVAFAQNNEEEAVNQYGIKVSKNPVVASEQDGILVLQGDNGFKFWYDCRVQTDFGFYFGEQDYANPIGNGASIRRARMAIKSQITPIWYGEVDMELANGSFELKDAIIRYTGFDRVQLTIGSQKPDFSLSRNTSSRYLEFMERPMIVSALAPSRHLGIFAKYADSKIFASGSILFQEIENQETRTYVEDHNKLAGMDEGLSYVGKIVFRPVNEATKGIHIGVAGIYREPKTSDEYGSLNYTRFSCRNTTNINRKKYIDTDDIKFTDHNVLATAELAGHINGLRVETAYLADWLYLDEDHALDKPYYFWGAYAEAGYLLFGGHQRYDSDGAKFNRVSTGKEWGDLEVTARYEYINMNSENVGSGIWGGSANLFGAGLNLYMGNNVKMMLNYQYVMNDKYANGKGSLYVGYDLLGNRTKDPTAVDITRENGVSYHMILARFQIAF